MIIKLMILMICLNTGLGVMHWYADGNGEVGLANAIQPNELPTFYNATSNNGGDYMANIDDTTTAVGQLRHSTNSTNTGETNYEFDLIQESNEYSLAQAWAILNWFDGGFVLGTVDNFTGAIGVELPPYIIEGFMALYGIGFALFIIYMVTGRGFSGFT